MFTKLLTPALVAAALSLAACGSSSSSSSTHHSASGKSTTASRPTRTYTVKLSGKAETPPGAPKGTGAAIIAFHGESQLCWRFSHLHGFSSPTFAHIHKGPPGTSGNIVLPLSTGPHLQHKGCVPINPSLTTAIWSSPAQYYVNIHSKQYPGGAVRAQL